MFDVSMSILLVCVVGRQSRHSIARKYVLTSQDSLLNGKGTLYSTTEMKFVFQLPWDIYKKIYCVLIRKEIVYKVETVRVMLSDPNLVKF